MGSYIAQEAAIERPARIGRLVLVVTTSHTETSATERVMAENPEDFAGASAQDIPMILARLALSPNASQATLERVTGEMSRPVIDDHRLILDHGDFAAASAALAGFDSRGRLGTIAAPTLVIAGRHDRFNPPEEGREVAHAIPGAVYLELDAGHGLSREVPQQYRAALAAFLTA